MAERVSSIGLTLRMVPNDPSQVCGTPSGPSPILWAPRWDKFVCGAPIWVRLIIGLSQAGLSSVDPHQVGFGLKDPIEFRLGQWGLVGLGQLVDPHSVRVRYVVPLLGKVGQRSPIGSGLVKGLLSGLSLFSDPRLGLIMVNGHLLGLNSMTWGLCRPK